MENIGKMSKSMLAIVYLMILFSVILMLIVVFNLGRLNIVENIRDYKVLKSLGFTDRTLVSMFIKENLLYSIIGVIIGMILAKKLTISILSSMGSSTDMLYLNSFNTKIIAIVFVISVSFIINLILSKKILKIDITRN